MTKHDAIQPADLDHYTFINPAYRPDHLSKEAHENSRASDLAYKVASLLDTIQLAFDNETSGIPMEQRGISQTLEIAAAIARDLIEETQVLERTASKGGTA